tara:strand:- start:4404 stop:4595 length:192 start_codon:yes stop_codon:yes gene_type:complete
MLDERQKDIIQNLQREDAEHERQIKQNKLKFKQALIFIFMVVCTGIMALDDEQKAMIASMFGY